MQHRELRQDLVDLGDDGVARLTWLCETGQQLLEQCYRDVGGAVR
jgi:hypothetical protein